MEIPIQITDSEDVSVELLKRSLETALYEANVDLKIPSKYTGVRGFYGGNIKVKKLAYSAIEQFNLPVVRTWYKYGQFEPYNRLRPKALDVGPRSNEAYVPSGDKIAVTEEHVVDYFLGLNLNEIFDQDVFEFLSDNYKEWEPEPYTDAYLSSTELIEVLEMLELMSNDEFIENIGDSYSQFKDASLDLRFHLKNIDTMEDDVESHVGEYLSSLDSTLLQVEETSELTEDQFQTIKQTRSVYHNYVLPWIGILISLDKSEGPEESLRAFDRSGEDILSTDKATWETQLKGWNTSLVENDLRADYETIRSVGPTDTSTIRSLQDAAFNDT